MARTNKYASLNFNDIYEKKTNKQQSSPSPSPSSSSSSSSLTTPNKTILSNSRIHGNMLVLSRPSPKPIPPPSPPPPPPPSTTTPDRIGFEPDSISLRPLGRTGSGPSLSLSPLPSPTQSKDKDISVSPKPNRFVPPHLRPGFLGREDKPGSEFQKQPGHRQGLGQGHFGSPNRYGEDGRPKSGGGYDRMRGGEPYLMEMKRPGSSETRPGSSG